MNLPAIRYLQAGPMAPEASMANAAAPARAMGEFGKVFEDLGQKGFQIMQQVREIDEDRKTSRYFAELNEEYARFEQEHAAAGDTNAAGAWRERREEMKSRLGGLGLSPVGRAAAEQRFIGWSSERNIRVEKQGYVKSVELGLASKATVIRGYQKTGNFDAARGEIDATPDALAGETVKQKLHEENRALEARHYLLEGAKDDPRGIQKLVSDPKFAAQNPQVGKATIALAHATAEKQRQADGFKAIDGFKKGVAEGVYFTAGQVDEHFPRASAGLRKLFQGVLEPDIPGNGAFAALPADQREIVGDVMLMTKHYRPAAEDFDQQYFAMDTKVETLPDGPAKRELRRTLERVRTGKLEQAETRADLHRRELDLAFDPEARGLAMRGKDAQALQAEGLLKDVVKLERRGHSAEQAREIASTGDPVEQLAKFREHSRYIPLTDQGGDWDRRAFEVVLTGDGAVEYEDRGLKQRYGAAKIRLEEWLHFHPDAKDGEFKSAVAEIVDPQGQAEVDGNFFNKAR
ncbi:hypothetical protein [Luteolibacter sp. Populi]|uniref:hypothetical protein n=1 Tax=Luteolibacter sp. Populi TaxID=3230487 RepID=UPI003465E9F2